MNEVPKIQVGLSQVNSQPAKAEEKAEEKVVETAQSKVYEDKSAQIMDSLDMTAKYNVASLGFKQVDPTKYLTPERIADIEASMDVFEKGVRAHLVALKDEFGYLGEFDSLGEADKFEMAAKSFVHKG